MHLSHYANLAAPLLSRVTRLVLLFYFSSFLSFFLITFFFCFFFSHFFFFLHNYNMLVHGGRDDLELPHLITTVTVLQYRRAMPSNRTGVVIHHRRRIRAIGSHHWCSRWWYTMKRSFDGNRWSLGGVVPSEAIINALLCDMIYNEVEQF